VSRIYVNFSKMNGLGNGFLDRASNLQNIKEHFNTTIQHLDWDIKFQYNINSTAKQLRKKLENYSDALKKYDAFLQEAEDKYRKLDQFKIDDNQSIFSMDTLKNVSFLYGLLSKLFRQLIGNLDGSGWKLGDALFSAFGLWLGTISSDAPKSKLELFRQFEDIMGSEVSILGKILKVFKKDEIGSAYGIAGSGVSIVGELSKFTEYTVPEALKKMGDLIDKGGSLGKSIFDTINSKNTAYKTKMVSDSIRDELAAVKSLFSMGTYFVGDVMERSADGKYDINDYGGTLLETGINGMSSVVRSYTGGIVNLDTDRATTIYNGVTDRVTDWIKNTNAPLPVQVALVAPGAVISAAVSTTAVFIDYGMQIGEKINDLISWLKR